MSQSKQLVTTNGDPLHYSPLTTSVLPQPPHMEAFTFGDPVPVLDQRASVYFGECSMVNHKWYSPPMDLDGLALTMRASPHHSSALYVKRNILVSTFKPHPLFSQLELCGSARKRGSFTSSPAASQMTMNLRPTASVT